MKGSGLNFSIFFLLIVLVYTLTEAYPLEDVDGAPKAESFTADDPVGIESAHGFSNDEEIIARVAEIVNLALDALEM